MCTMRVADRVVRERRKLDRRRNPRGEPTGVVAERGGATRACVRNRPWSSGQDPGATAGQPLAALVDHRRVGCPRTGRRTMSPRISCARRSRRSSDSRRARVARRPPASDARRRVRARMCAIVSTSSSRASMAPNGTTRASRTAGHSKVSSTPCALPTPSFSLSSSPRVGCSPPAPPQAPPTFDVIIRGGTVYDGTGSAGTARRRRHQGRPHRARRRPLGRHGHDARSTPPGRAVAPGFINMLSWATESLIADGRSQGDIRQGVTLEIFGEGSSMGPLNDAMKKRMVEEMGDIKYDITWTTLAGVSEGARDGAASRPTSPRSSAPRRSASTSSAWKTRRATPAAARADARARPAGDGGGRARHRQLAHLRAGVLCLDRRVDRAVQGRGAVSGQVHLAHAQRGQPPRRGGRRADSDQPRGEDSGRDLPPQGGRQGQLVQDGRGHRDDREGPRRAG